MIVKEQNFLLYRRPFISFVQSIHHFFRKGNPEYFFRKGNPVNFHFGPWSFQRKFEAKRKIEISLLNSKYCLSFRAVSDHPSFEWFGFVLPFESRGRRNGFVVVTFGHNSSTVANFNPWSMCCCQWNFGFGFLT